MEKSQANARPSRAGKMRSSRVSGKLGTRYTWDWMRFRCYNPRCHGYENYGGRGIRICERWKNSFTNFLSDMGPRPEHHVIDRVDVNGDYTPKNCRWIHASLSNRTRRGIKIPYEPGEDRATHERKVHRAWVKKNYERRLNYMRRYNAKHQEHQRGVHRRWAAANREWRNEYQRIRARSKMNHRLST